MEPAPFTPPSRGWLHRITDRQTYLNIAYLLLSFPLGIAYFVFAVTGVSLGVGLAVTYIGIPILVLVLWSAKRIAALEGAAANAMLKLEPPQAGETTRPAKGFWPFVKHTLTDPASYTSLLYMIVKLPLGIVSFVSTVTLLSVSLALTVAPVAYIVIGNALDIDIFDNDSVTRYLFPNLSSLQMSFIYAAIGIVLLFVSLGVLNRLAVWFAKLNAAFASALRH